MIALNLYKFVIHQDCTEYQLYNSTATGISVEISAMRGGENIFSLHCDLKRN